MITEVLLDNFLSFPEGTKIPLKKLTLVIGPNSSGKSNFFSALRGLSELTRSPWTAIGGIAENRSMELMKKQGASEFSIALRGGVDGVIGAKFFYKCIIHATQPLLFSEYFEGQNGSDLPAEKHQLMRRSGQASELLHSGGVQAGAVLLELRKYLNGVRHFQFQQSSLRAPVAIVANPEVRFDGLGIPAVLDQLQSEFPESFERLQDDFRKCVPEIERVLLRTAVQGAKMLLFKERGLKENLIASQVSEGMLILLALLAIVHSEPKPSMILIEDIEKGVHPRRLREIVDILRAVTNEHPVQVIVSTHSPYLLDSFHDDLDAVLVFERTSQGTLVKTGADALTPIGGLHGSTLGEAWYSGVFGGVPS